MKAEEPRPNIRLLAKHDLANVVILLAIALVIGVYLITTTVLIAKDGISYINYAKRLAVAPLEIIRDCSEYAPQAYTPGYPFLILITHELVDLFGDGTSVLSWIYSAQAIALFCRIFSLVPLYFIGKELVGSTLSFWAILILVTLPYPASFGSDALRDWPHMLFLATGFLLLLRAAKGGKCVLFGLAGLIAGLGYTVRPMCAQLVVCGVLWLLLTLFTHKAKCNMSRLQLLTGLALLVIGFSLVAVPYMKARGEFLPRRLQQALESFSSCPTTGGAQEKHIANYTAELAPGDVIKALGELINNISENLMYYFVPALFIGMHYYFRRKLKSESMFLITALLLANIAIAILRYCISPELSKRYILPVIAFAIFFVPLGLKIMSGWIEGALSRRVCRNEGSERESQRWFFILLATGLAICAPKLFRPIRIEKKDYRLAAKWLNTNTSENSVIAISNLAPRIAFYSDRKTLSVANSVMPQNADFAVNMYEGDATPIYVDRALTFNGTDVYVDVGANPIPSSGDFTISVWVYCEGELTSRSDDFGTAFGSATFNADNRAVRGLAVRTRKSLTGELKVVWGDGEKWEQLSLIKEITTKNTRKWYHVAIVYTCSDNTLKAYINGIFKDSAIQPYITSGCTFRIGHSTHLNVLEAYWYGKVSDMRIDKKALSSNEILTLSSSDTTRGKRIRKYTIESQKGKRSKTLVLYRLPWVLEQ